MKKLSVGALVLTLAVMLLSQAANGFFVDGSGNATAKGTITAADGFGYVPIGTILPYYKIKSTPTDPILNSELPPGWALCNAIQVLAPGVENGSALDLLDGVNGNGFTTPDLNSTTNNPNNLSPAPTSRGLFLRGGDFAGKWEDDQFQSHTHQTMGVIGAFASGGVPNSSGPLVVPYSRVDNPISTGPLVEGTNGTPRKGAETRPVNMSVVYIMRVK